MKKSRGDARDFFICKNFKLNYFIFWPIRIKMMVNFAGYCKKKLDTNVPSLLEYLKCNYLTSFLVLPLSILMVSSFLSSSKSIKILSFSCRFLVTISSAKASSIYF